MKLLILCAFLVANVFASEECKDKTNKVKNPSEVINESVTTKISNVIIRNTDISQTVMGNEGGHGGDSYSYEFVALAKKVSSWLNEKSSKKVKKYNINISEFIGMIDSTLVYSKEAKYVTLNGSEVDAINFPETKRILLNRTRWRDASVDEKLKVVFHEYLGLLNVERDVYTVSIHFEEDLNELAQHILKSNESIAIKHYGQCRVSLPLQYTGGACDTSQKGVDSAIECSKSMALNKCYVEKGEECNVLKVDLAVVSSDKFYGFQYCEVSTIVQ